MVRVHSTIHTAKQKTQPRRIVIVIVCVLLVIAFILTIVHGYRYYHTPIQIREFAKQNHISLWRWPKDLTEMLERNPEAESFVLNYPLKKDVPVAIDLSEHLKGDGLPLLMQWDERWGYDKYAGELMGLSGCGPTCLSMVCIYLLQDPQYTPRYVAEFATAKGYAVTGNGSAWTLISVGGEELGLDVTEIPLIESQI